MRPFIAVKDLMLSSAVAGRYTPAERLVALAIANRMSPQGRAWMSRDDIAERTDLSVTTVRRAIKRLCEGEIAIFRRRRPGAGHVWNFSMAEASTAETLYPNSDPRQLELFGDRPLPGSGHCDPGSSHCDPQIRICNQAEAGGGKPASGRVGLPGADDPSPRPALPLSEGERKGPKRSDPDRGAIDTSAEARRRAETYLDYLLGRAGAEISGIRPLLEDLVTVGEYADTRKPVFGHPQRSRLKAALASWGGEDLAGQVVVRARGP